MDKDISNMMKKFSDMMNESSSYDNSSVENKKKETNDFNFSSMSAESLNNIVQIFRKNGSNENNSTNIDINTILRLKSVMDKMNNQNDPRSNLLKSLKPYLRESRQSKADQYINLLNMGKVIEAFRESEGNTE